MSWEDDSDLTELTSSEDESVAPIASTSKSTTTTKRTTRTPKAAAEQTSLRPALSAPRSTTYAAETLFRYLHLGWIDLEPDYQREVVWTTTKQIGLIDSIMHNYHVPPLVFAKHKNDRFTCIDGKQRLTSILNFMEGSIHHKDHVTGSKSWYTNAPKGQRLLHPDHALRFSMAQIVVMEYSDLTGEQERQIFQRVQLGVALTPAERMMAISGEYPNLIREMQAKINSKQGFEGHLDWSSSRGRDFQSMAQVVFLIKEGDNSPEPSTKKVEDWLNEKEKAPASVQSAIALAVDVLCRLVQHETLSEPLKYKKLAPVELVMVLYLIHLNRNKLSLTQVSDAIQKLRKDVRTTNTDVRFNTKIFKQMKAFIKNVNQKKMQFKSDGKGDTPVAKLKPRQSATAPPPPAPSASTSKPPAKRVSSSQAKGKQKAVESDAEEDYEQPIPPKRKRVTVCHSDDSEGEYEPRKSTASRPKKSLRTLTSTSAAAASASRSYKAGSSTKPAPASAKTASSATTKSPAKNKSAPAKPALQSATPSVKPTAPSSSRPRTKSNVKDTAPRTSSAAAPSATPIRRTSTKDQPIPTASASAHIPLPKKTPLPSKNRVPSAPLMASVDTAMQPPPVRIKHESSASPAPMQLSHSAPPVSKNNLAAMRAARAATARSDSVASTSAPSSSSMLRATSQSEPASPAREPRRNLSSTSVQADNEPVFQTQLEKFLGATNLLNQTSPAKVTAKSSRWDVTDAARKPSSAAAAVSGHDVVPPIVAPTPAAAPVTSTSLGGAATSTGSSASLPPRSDVALGVPIARAVASDSRVSPPTGPRSMRSTNIDIPRPQSRQASDMSVSPYPTPTIPSQAFNPNASGVFQRTADPRLNSINTNRPSAGVTTPLTPPPSATSATGANGFPPPPTTGSSSVGSMFSDHRRLSTHDGVSDPRKPSDTSDITRDESAYPERGRRESDESRSALDRYRDGEPIPLRRRSRSRSPTGGRDGWERDRAYQPRSASRGRTTPRGLNARNGRGRMS